MSALWTHCAKAASLVRPIGRFGWTKTARAMQFQAPRFEGKHFHGASAPSAPSSLLPTSTSQTIQDNSPNPLPLIAHIIDPKHLQHEIISRSSLGSCFPEDFRRLLAGEVRAIHIPRFTSPELSKTIATALMKIGYEYYSYAQGSVGRIGMSFSEVFGMSGVMTTHPEACLKEDEARMQAVRNARAYYGRSQDSINTIRGAISPFLSPLDKLRLQLDEVWPSGASLAQAHPSRKMFVGLCRIIEPHEDIYAHQDMLEWDAPNLPLASQLMGQLSANVYLDVPEQGGELRLWDFGLDAVKYKELSEGFYGIRDETKLGPCLSIKPGVGDLIIFNSRKLHSIGRGSHKRVALSTFIGFQGENQPLKYWS